MNYLPSGYAVLSALYANHSYIKRIDVKEGNPKATVTLAIQDGYTKVNVPGVEGEVPAALLAIDFIKSHLGDDMNYQYVVEKEIPSLREILQAWGADPLTIYQLEMVTNMVEQNLFDWLDELFGKDEQEDGEESK